MIHPLWLIINVIWFLIMYIVSMTENVGWCVVGMTYYIVMLMVEKLYDED